MWFMPVFWLSFVELSVKCSRVLWWGDFPCGKTSRISKVTLPPITTLSLVSLELCCPCVCPYILLLSVRIYPSPAHHTIPNSPGFLPHSFVIHSSRQWGGFWQLLQPLSPRPLENLSALIPHFYFCLQNLLCFSSLCLAFTLQPSVLGECLLLTDASTPGLAPAL